MQCAKYDVDEAVIVAITGGLLHPDWTQSYTLYDSTVTPDCGTGAVQYSGTLSATIAPTNRLVGGFGIGLTGTVAVADGLYPLSPAESTAVAT